jgi:hypothetical protein
MTKGGNPNKIKHDKYFAILLDCIREDGHVELMTMMLRYPGMEKGVLKSSLLDLLLLEK